MALSPYEQLEQEFRRLHAFRGALSLLRWDAAVMMPRGSADVRGEQLAALETEHHALLTTPKVARLIERAEAGSSQLEDWPLANLREMRRQRDHAIATPPSLIARLAKATARAEVFWVEARKANDFKIFAPHLEEVVHLVRDKAALLGQARGLAPYDALVDAFTPGISTADIDTIFKALSRKLPGLINQAIEVQADRAPIPLVGKFSVSRQRSLAVDVLKALGFPFDRGRLDESEHPFTEGVPGDIRVTTRPWSCARGKPVAAVRNEPVPQPFFREVSEAAAGKIFAGQRSGMERRQSLPASHAREAQSDSHGRG
jgi:carboxypeptidase Taq